MAQNLTIKRGNTTNITLNIDPIEVKSGDTIYFTAKSEYDNDTTDSLAVIKKDISGNVSEEGVVDFELTARETNIEPGKYVYDITANFTGKGRSTLLDGKITIKPVATLRGIN